MQVRNIIFLTSDLIKVSKLHWDWCSTREDCLWGI